MTDTGMTATRVLELIEAYGGAPDTWPEAERAGAQALIDAQPEVFEAALLEACRLDGLIAVRPEVEPYTDLYERILDDAPMAEVRGRSGLAWFKSLILPQGIRWPAGAAFASLMIGVVGGYAYASTGTVESFDQIDQAYGSSFDLDAADDWLNREEGA